MTRTTDVIVIGGGQAGLATSHWLTRLGVDHLVFERGQIAQRWRAERWNSLRLLTPNWMTRLPGHAYQGGDPHGFMHKDEVAQFLARYARNMGAPVLTDTHVHAVRRMGDGFAVDTTFGRWNARAIVLATGACDTPNVPKFAQNIPAHIQQVTLDKYKSPHQVEQGGVLVVGASASGLQIAAELQKARRPVTLAAGGHTRIPRRYRGRDIMQWLDQSGQLTRPRDPSASPDKCAMMHSFQLVGDARGQSLDLMRIHARGGLITGKLLGTDGTRLHFDTGLRSDISRAETRQEGILDAIDSYIRLSGIQAPPRTSIAPVTLPDAPAALDLDRAGIKTIIWATGYRRDYSWLDIPVLTPRGEIIQTGGVSAVPGLYTMGLPVMRRINSTYIDGVAADARAITHHLARHLGHSAMIAA